MWKPRSSSSRRGAATIERLIPVASLAPGRYNHRRHCHRTCSPRHRHPRRAIHRKSSAKSKPTSTLRPPNSKPLRLMGRMPTAHARGFSAFTDLGLHELFLRGLAGSRRSRRAYCRRFRALYQSKSCNISASWRPILSTIRRATSCFANSSIPLAIRPLPFSG